MQDKIRNLIRNRRGANMVEYIILVGVVALFAIAAFKYFNSSLVSKARDQADTIAGINSSTGE